VTVGVFDFLNDISFDKKYLFSDDTESAYNSFIINQGLMQHIDTVMLANETNKMGSLPKRFHHDYLFYSVDKSKRFGKWAKQDKSDEELLQLVMNKYTINREVAIGYLRLMSDEDKQQLINLNNEKGGKK
jgi:hypothetical protein